jgi:hypothetical protein
VVWRDRNVRMRGSDMAYPRARTQATSMVATTVRLEIDIDRMVLEDCGGRLVCRYWR